MNCHKNNLFLLTYYLKQLRQTWFHCLYNWNQQITYIVHNQSIQDIISLPFFAQMKRIFKTLSKSSLMPFQSLSVWITPQWTFTCYKTIRFKNYVQWEWNSCSYLSRNEIGICLEWCLKLLPYFCISLLVSPAHHLLSAAIHQPAQHVLENLVCSEQASVTWLQFLSEDLNQALMCLNMIHEQLILKIQ